MLYLVGQPPPHLENGDLFTRADGALGSDWYTENLTGSDATKIPVIVSNGVRMATATTNNTNYQGLGVYKGQMCMSDYMRTYGTCTNANTGLVGGLGVRASRDGQNLVFAVGSTASTIIQSRISGTFATRATISGNHWTTGDIFMIDAVLNVYTVYRIRSGSTTTIGSWTDSGNLFVPSVDRRFPAFLGQCDRNVIGTQNWGLGFNEVVGYDLAA